MKRILLAGDIKDQNLSESILYLQCLRKVGAVPALAAAFSEADAQAYAEAFDALILTGGADVAPARYNQVQHPSVILNTPERDFSDEWLFHAFRASGKRILGVCRGCQVANVCLGGTLHQHLPDSFDPVLWHARNLLGRHKANIAPGSLLAELLGAGETAVNTSHHQAIDQPGAGLTITAYAPDGVVEAAEAPNILLVQWHPEWMSDEMMPIFEWISQ